MSSILQSPSRYFRALAPKAEPQRIDMDAKVIYGASVATIGEALGHELWLDAEFLDQVVTGGNASRNGVKVRFGHPMSGDGLGKAVARARDFRRVGNQVLADLHMLAAAEQSPDGDLVGYVLRLASEDPAMFGMSIVYEPDWTDEEDFCLEHKSPGGAFRSPDPRNVNHYAHARLKTLRAADVVDEPATNPDGMFHAGGEVFAFADHLLSYVFCNAHPPSMGAFGVAPERVRDHMKGWLARNGLAVAETKEEEPVMGDTNEQATPAVDVDALQAAAQTKGVDTERARVAAIMKAFSKDPQFAAEQVGAGASLLEAKAAYADVLAERLEAEQQHARQTPASVPTKGVHLAASRRDDEQPTDFMAEVRVYSARNRVSMTEAMKAVDQMHPGLRLHSIVDPHGKLAAALAANREG